MRRCALTAVTTLLLWLAPLQAWGLTWTYSQAVSSQAPQQADATAAECTLAQLRYIGSHNSYKQQLPDAWYQRVEALGVPTAALHYQHPPLTTQLNMGLRLLELDILADPKGGLYQPAQDVLALTSLHALATPGFKVLHLPGVDMASHCPLLADCVSELASWSRQHPAHAPVLVLINIRERAVQPTGRTLATPALSESTRDAVDGAVPAFVPPVHWQAADFAALDAQLRASFGQALLTPAQVRRQGMSLAASIQQFGWPTLQSSRGKWLFVLDAELEQLQRYQAATEPHLAEATPAAVSSTTANSGSATLAAVDATAQTGSVMFGSWPLTHPNAGIMVLNDPIDQADAIQQALRLGFLVRTRSDDALQLTPARVASALQSGAQFISSDFYAGAPQGQPDQQVQWPDTAAVTAPAARHPAATTARPMALENPRLSQGRCPE